mmetsp:Transcript_60584/g.141882  ORF Transcript_60584/g.141882 Transcript_60584/m.141882 type:complete len:201 (+) Transcript_60584:125-727(+)
MMLLPLSSAHGSRTISRRSLRRRRWMHGMRRTSPCSMTRPSPTGRFRPSMVREPQLPAWLSQCGFQHDDSTAVSGVCLMALIPWICCKERLATAGLWPPWQHWLSIRKPWRRSSRSMAPKQTADSCCSSSTTAVGRWWTSSWTSTFPVHMPTGGHMRRSLTSHSHMETRCGVSSSRRRWPSCSAATHTWPRDSPAVAFEP